MMHCRVWLVILGTSALLSLGATPACSSSEEDATADGGEPVVNTGDASDAAARDASDEDDAAASDANTDADDAPANDAGADEDDAAASDAGADEDDAGSQPEPTYRVNVTVSGLEGQGLVLQNNAGDDLAVAADGTVSFATLLPTASPFDVTVMTQPSTPTQRCTVTDGQGAIAGADVTANVACVTTGTLGGFLSGMKGTGLVLALNGTPLPAIDANGALDFGALPVGTDFEVTIDTQPTDQASACKVTHGRGNLTAAGFGHVYVECGSVLLLHATNYPSSIENTLLATNAFASVAVFNGRSTTPTAADLAKHSAVLVVADGTFASAATFGDLLADYVDGGGRVVMAAFSNMNNAISGRWLTDGYNMLVMGSQTSDSVSGALTFEEPDSPLVIGAFNLSALSAYRSRAAVANGAVVVARWADGTPLVLRQEKNGVKRAELNFFPAPANANAYFWTGDGAPLLANALLYR